MSAAAGTPLDEEARPSCDRYAWCVRETTAYARDGSPARFHHGVATRLQAGDETVILERLATDDTGEEFVEIRMASVLSARQLSAWLDLREAQLLGELLRGVGRAGSVSGT